MIGRDRIQYKSPDQVRLMRRAGLLVGQTLQRLREAAVAGTTTRELERARRAARSGTPGRRRASWATATRRSPAPCASRSTTRSCTACRASGALQDGDVVSIDCGAIVEGWHGDSAISLVVGGDEHADPADLELLRVTEESMWRGIAALAVGERLHAVGAAVEDPCCRAEPEYGIVEEYVGHGIGTEMHQDPQVPNYRVRDKGVRVRSGLVVAIEPMLTRGSAQTRVLADDWTVVTPGRLARSPLRAHRRGQRRRAVGAHRAGRRRAEAGRARRDIRPARLTR